MTECTKAHLQQSTISKSGGGPSDPSLSGMGKERKYWEEETAHKSLFCVSASGRSRRAGRGAWPSTPRWRPRNIMRINSKPIQLQQGRLLRRSICRNANKPPLLSYGLQMKKKSQEIHHLGTQKMQNYA